MEQHFRPYLGLLKLAFDQMSPFALLDENGRYVYANSTWEEASGRKIAEVLGHNVEEVVPDTHARLAMKEERTIVAHPVHGMGKKEYYTTYIPLCANEKVIGCAIHVIFIGTNAAMEFSSTLPNMLKERNYYCQEMRRFRKEAKYCIDDIIGESPPMRELKRQICQTANSASTVLLVGETGTGKELAAHSIHNISLRSTKPFVKINCTTIPDDLAESELFGYDYGAFTGAKRGGKPGKFEMANMGSLFLDEVNHMSLRMQPKLLRVIQEQEIEHIGGSNCIPVDVRLISATNVPLEDLMEKNNFRRDLYYRLNVIQIHIPPLRKRLEDIPLLADYLIGNLNQQLGMHVEGIGAEAIEFLQEYDWPGNVRELRNVLERAMNVRLKGTLLQKDFAGSLSRKVPVWSGPVPGKSGFYQSFRDLKRRTEETALREMLESCGGNKRRAAEKLGISRTLLYRKIKQYGLEPT